MSSDVIGMAGTRQVSQTQGSFDQPFQVDRLTRVARAHDDARSWSAPGTDVPSSGGHDAKEPANAS